MKNSQIGILADTQNSNIHSPQFSKDKYFLLKVAKFNQIFLLKLKRYNYKVRPS